MIHACELCKYKDRCVDRTTSNVADCNVFVMQAPQTNADKIRSMSDEELAEFLCGVFDEDECNGKYICGVTIPDYDEDRIAAWLKSKVKE